MTYTLDCTQLAGVGDGNMAQKDIYMQVAARTGATGVEGGQLSPVSKIFCANVPDRPTVQDTTGTETSITISWTLGTLNQAELISHISHISLIDNICIIYV